MSDWWTAIEHELDKRSDGAPDPWGALFIDDEPELTDDQRAYLEGLDDQPPVTRLGGLDDSTEP